MRWLTTMVQTLSGEGYAETPLIAGTIAWFSPGTIHRLVNLDGRLELHVLMSNAGLSEAGDMVLALEPDVLADEARYALRISRRTNTGLDDLTPLHDAAVDLVTERAAGSGGLPGGDLMIDLRRSQFQIDAIAAEPTVAVRLLTESAIRDTSLLPATRRMGCCGNLGTVVH